jgi:hypothetical protein
MNERQLRRTENAKKAAQEDLVEADAQAAKAENGAGSHAGPFQKQLARKMRRAAKRRMSKADRRQGRVICDMQWDEDDHDSSSYN